MDEQSNALCATVSVEIERDVTFGFPASREIYIEAPANVRRGVYDIDLIGAFTYLGGRETFMRHISSVGRFCSIASNVVAGQMEHPTDHLSAHPIFQGAFAWQQLEPFRTKNRAMIRKVATVARAKLKTRDQKIVIGNDVWIGEGVFIRRGVEIGDGAIIAARSVVSNDVPPYAIVGGSPARLIRMRFSDEIVAELLRLTWWSYGLSALARVDFTDIEAALATIDANIASGRAEPYDAPFVRIDTENRAGLYTYDFDLGAFSPIALSARCPQ